MNTKDRRDYQRNHRVALIALNKARNALAEMDALSHQQAVNAKADTFMFDDNEFVVDYAKYLIAYLESAEVQAKLRPE